MNMNSYPNFPKAINEAVKEYRPESPETIAVLARYRELYKQNSQIPLTINGEKITTQQQVEMRPPHDHQHCLGHYSLAGKKEVEKAIESALEARTTWSRLAFEERATIFLRAAELIAGPYRTKINAATMLAQSKNIHQAEIDAACEFIDFLRFNFRSFLVFHDSSSSQKTKSRT